MAAGFKYDLKPMEVTREMCRIDTIQRLSGGVNFEDADVLTGTLLMPLTPLVVDLKTRKAKAVKNVRVVEKVASGTKVKVAKYSLAYVGMFICDGTTTVKVSAIDKSKADYDTITVSAAITPEAGVVLFETASADDKTPKHAANMLNYATTSTVPLRCANLSYMLLLQRSTRRRSLTVSSLFLNLNHREYETDIGYSIQRS